MGRVELQAGMRGNVLHRPTFGPLVNNTKHPVNGESFSIVGCPEIPRVEKACVQLLDRCPAWDALLRSGLAATVLLHLPPLRLV